ncbi:MAG: phosphoribosylaminoimidazolesuccinocarboxamide synthase [Pseudomonadota bacterium]
MTEPMILAEGKTKRILAGDNPHTVLMEAKDSLSGGDAAKLAAIDSIGACKTRQAANALGLVASAGVPTAYVRHDGPATLLCEACEMLPLEFVVRRFAWGSFLKRNPEYKADVPHRFDQPVWEVFHKDTLVGPPLSARPFQISEAEARERYLRGGVWPAGVYTDPFIDAQADHWGLYDPKAPLSGDPKLWIDPLLTPQELAQAVERIVLPTFAALEAAWARIDTLAGPVWLVDMKVELGRRTRDGALVLADVVDNDSWRIWPGGEPTRQLDKQCFRDGDPLSAVAENYRLVAELTDRFAA